MPVAWLTLAAAYLLSAVGVARRWRWARVSAGVLGGWLLASGLATLVAQPLLRGPSSPGAIVAVLLGAVVLFTMLRRW